MRARIGRDGGGECGSYHILSLPLIYGGGPMVWRVAGEEEPGRRRAEEDRQGWARSVEEWSRAIGARRKRRTDDGDELDQRRRRSQPANAWRRRIQTTARGWVPTVGATDAASSFFRTVAPVWQRTATNPLPLLQRPTSSFFKIEKLSLLCLAPRRWDGGARDGAEQIRVGHQKAAENTQRYRRESVGPSTDPSAVCASVTGRCWRLGTQGAAINLIIALLLLFWLNLSSFEFVRLVCTSQLVSAALVRGDVQAPPGRAGITSASPFSLASPVGPHPPEHLITPAEAEKEAETRTGRSVMFCFAVCLVHAGAVATEAFIGVCGFCEDRRLDSI
jgi:hypothetical protein